MKIIADPVDMVAKFIVKEKPIPVKFRYHEDDMDIEIKVDKIIEIEETKIAGIKAYIYRCQSQISGVVKRYELKYILDKCRWELYKM